MNHHPHTEPDTLTPFEQIAYWLAITVASAITAGLVCGVMGYLYVWMLA